MEYEKKYKEALAKCKAYIDDTQKRWSEEFCKATEEVFFEIFPELAESEDERIRKALIDLVKSKEEDGYMVINNFSTGSILAWLEKQASKPKWSEEDEDHWMMCLECVEECATQEREDFSKTIEGLKQIKQRMEEQQ